MRTDRPERLPIQGSGRIAVQMRRLDQPRHTTHLVRVVGVGAETFALAHVPEANSGIGAAAGEQISLGSVPRQAENLGFVPHALNVIEG
jgi:hypothetical protein